MQNYESSCFSLLNTKVGKYSPFLSVTKKQPRRCEGFQKGQYGWNDLLDLQGLKERAKAIHLLYFIENKTNDSHYQDSIFKAELKSQSKLRISACILGEEGSKARV